MPDRRSLGLGLGHQTQQRSAQGIIAGLFAMLELAGGITVARIPRSLHSAVRRVLWPAESAMRRLIVIAARGLVVKLPPRVRSRVPSLWDQSGKAGAHVPPSSSSIRGKTSERHPAEIHAQHPPAHPFLGRRSHGGIPVGSAPALAPSRRPPMAWSMPCPSPGGSRSSSRHSRTCRARPGVLPAGGQGARPCQVRSSDHRSGLAVLPAPQKAHSPGR